MDITTFDKIVLFWHQRIDELLLQKGIEYARIDRLSNFKQIAKMRSILPEDALIALVSKQWVSILDMVKDLDNGTDVVPHNVWREKIGDVIVYMILLDALVSERYDKCLLM